MFEDDNAPNRTQAPSSLQNWKWTPDMLERKMYEYIAARTENDGTLYAFRRFDHDRKGFITVQDLIDAYADSDMEISRETADILFERYDVDGDGIITVNDFSRYINHPRLWGDSNIEKFDTSALREAQRELSELAALPRVSMGWELQTLIDRIRQKLDEHTVSDGSQMRHAFRLFDPFGTGSVTREQMRDTIESFGLSISDEEEEILFTRFDGDGDGVINILDFATCVLPQDFQGVTNYNQLRRPCANNTTLVDRKQFAKGDGSLKHFSSMSRINQVSREDLRADAAEFSRKTCHVPGYSGFVPGAHCIAGRTFARTTARALRKDPLHIATGNVIPKSPQQKSFKKAFGITKDQQTGRKLPRVINNPPNRSLSTPTL